MSKYLAEIIFQTIVFYDILNYPLTSFEIWKYLIAVNEKWEIRSENIKCSLGDIARALENKELKKYIEEFRGFYFLKGRRKLVEKRIQNSKNSIVKYKIAERVTKWLQFVPFVRMVAVTGTLAMKNSKEKSDIDFLIILEKNRIFTGRLLVTLVIHFLGKRRYEDKIKNRICLNYFITTKSLKIKKQNLFAANEYSFIYPLFGFDLYKKFGKENIKWIKRYKPNFEFSELKPAKHFVEIKSLQKKIQNFFEGLINLFWGDRLESWLKKKQIARIKRNPLTYKEEGYIEYTDENLVFLPEPQSRQIEEEWQKKLENLKIKLCNE